MHFQRLHISFLLLCLLSAASLFAQKSKCTIKGTISVKDGPSYPYRLELETTSNSAKGISVTDQDGTALRTKVSCMVKRQINMLMVNETVALGSLPMSVQDSMEVCFVGAVLKWKEKKGTVYFHGAFAGKNKKGDVCSEGKIELSMPASDFPFKDEPAKEETKNTDVSADTSAQQGFQKITTGIDKQISWMAAACTLEVWDGGVVDGDAVTILVNDKEVLRKTTLTGEKLHVVVPIAAGRNVITIVAGDEGSAPPCTAQVILYDGDTQHKVTAFNKKGNTANIILQR